MLRWEPCSDVLHYTHSVGSMIPIHRELQEAGLRGLVLSGGCVEKVESLVMSDAFEGRCVLTRVVCVVWERG